MTWNYSGDPGASVKDEVRFLIGDTAELSPLLTDEEILATLNRYPLPYRAAAHLARVLGARFTRSVNKSIDGLSISSGSLAKAFFDLADQLDEQAEQSGLAGAAIYAGGLSELEKDLDDADTGLVQPAFTKRDERYYPYDRRREKGLRWRS